MIILLLVSDNLNYTLWEFIETPFILTKIISRNESFGIPCQGKGAESRIGSAPINIKGINMIS